MLFTINEHCKITYAKEKSERLQGNVRKKIELVLDVEVPVDETKLEKAVVEEKAADMVC